jgi:ERCC4-type nuclease
VKAKPKEPLVILVDDREQLPLSFTCATERVHLPVGDYSARGCTELVAIERKQLDELATCCGTDRARFIQQVERLRSFPVRGLVVEGSFGDVADGNFESAINPLSVIGTLVKIANDWRVPVWLCGSPKHAAVLVERVLLRVHKQRLEGTVPNLAPELRVEEPS